VHQVLNQEVETSPEVNQHYLTPPQKALQNPLKLQVLRGKRDSTPVTGSSHDRAKRTYRSPASDKNADATSLGCK
jgi:hypothetical protein